MDAAREARRIRPYAGNPRYWQHKGRPVVLLGGTVDDNLFQIPDLEEHLDLLASVGGNYIRNTMSDRPDQGYEVKAFKRLDDGRYELNQWNDVYWDRFETMLRLTAERDVVVQIELWDRFDHSRGNWESDPFNPGNNVNYTFEESGLAPEYPEHPLHNKQPFFFTVPTLQNNAVVLPFQKKFVDKVLSYTLPHDHVLYCMDNETCGVPEWGAYWAGYIRDRARGAGVTVELTEMWDQWDVTGPMHRATFDHPELYTFVDISQNSQTTGEANWDNAQWVRAYLADHPRPMNETKIYGADTSKWLDRGIDSTHGMQTFWRNILGGFASSRFHRPPSGLGLSETAQAQLRSARLLLAELDIFRCEPDSGHSLLVGRETNAAYLTRIDGEQYAVYFPDGGRVGLDLRRATGRFECRWLAVDGSRWAGTREVSGGDVVPLAPPASGQWVALLCRAAGT
ncbi:MAG: hypothetical protein GXY85_00190 [Candidatus Brocadiaceae bacterium]|nr:hypothetical protein [Candidatus Brocadiaceae bacterium]